jgi:hypothetical protein
MVFLQGSGENSGYRLYLDKKLVIDEWVSAHELVTEATLDLQLGPHQFQLDYFVHEGGTIWV